MVQSVYCYPTMLSMKVCACMHVCMFDVRAKAICKASVDQW